MSNPDGPQHIYGFGDFTLNTARAVLLKNGEEIKLRPQSFEVLRLLLANHDRLVSKEELHAEVWGQKAVTDDSIAQCLIDIRRVIGDTDRQIIRTVPRRGYTLVGDVSIESVDSSSPPPLQRNHRQLWWWVAVAPILIVLAWLAATELREKSPLQTNQLIPGSSVAVLPFLNMSPDPDNEYFSDGLSETLLHKLAQVRELKVAARTSSFAFKGKDTGIREIGATLGVAHVLEGSVRRAGDRIRITAQLVRTHDGFHVWSENYDRELTDIFMVQDEIAGAVGVKLLASLLHPVEANRRRALDTDNFEAYDLYLRARAEVRNGSIGALQKAEEYLLAALEEDPDFLDAKAELADLVLQQADTGMRPIAEGIARQTALAGEVLAVDPKHVKARSLLITTRVMSAANNGDFTVWKKAERELREVVAAAPNEIDAKISLGFLVGRFGNREEAVTILEEVLEADPLNILIYEFLAQTHALLHDYEAARDVLLRAVEIDPEAPNVWAELFRIALRLGDGVLAIDSRLKSQASDALDPELPAATAEFLYVLGLPDEANEFHRRVRGMAPDSEHVQNLELLRAVALGQMDTAVRIARDIIDDGPSERLRAWSNATHVLLSTSVARGTEQEDIIFMDEHVPDFSNLEKIEVAWMTNLVRIRSLDVLSATKTDAELRAFSESIVAYYRQMNIETKSYPHVYLDWQILLANQNAAVQFALNNVFSKPVTAMLPWRLRFARPFMGEFLSDPEIQEALQRWDQQEQRIRSEVRDYLANR